MLFITVEVSISNAVPIPPIAGVLASLVAVMLPLALITRAVDMVTTDPTLYMLRSIRGQGDAIKSVVLGGFPGYVCVSFASTHLVVFLCCVFFFLKKQET